MSSGIIFNGGNSGGGNPYALGVNLPAPIVLKGNGNGKGVNVGSTIFGHGSDYVNNEIGQGALQIYFPNARYNGINGQTNLVSNIWDTINKYDPYIFMFHWKRRISSNAVNHKSHRPNRVLYHGGWTHPANIIDGATDPRYTNYGTTTHYFAGYPFTNNGAINNIQAQSEWSLQKSEQILNLVNLNPFRYYRNADAANNNASQYFNTDKDFFNAGIQFEEWVKLRSRNGAHNRSGYEGGNPHITNNPRQSDFNVYLAFALVIQNPENTNQYIVGPLSNVVKQSLVMGINSTSKKVPKGFAYRV